MSEGGVVQLELTFLGTGSALPSATRNHTCIALRLDAAVWLFDVGEGSQHQLMKSANIRIGKIEKIFLTHLHGDHVFGLPGLLCTMTNAVGGGNNREEESAAVSEEGSESATTTTSSKRPPLQIYGPSGTRKYVRNSLKSSYSRLGLDYLVHELLLNSDEATKTEEGEAHPNELQGTDLIIDTTTNSWSVFEDERCSVIASPLTHTVPSIGFVVTERPAAGKLNIDLAKPILERHKDVIASQLKIKNPMSLLAKVKAGNTVSLPDGTVILSPSDVVGPPRPGRKVVVLGDTSDNELIVPFCSDADVIVHEATNAKLSSDLRTTEEEVEKTTKDHGHSTPQMAGSFAKRCGAKSLVLTHFSQRYKGDKDEASLSVMREIRDLAVREFGCDNVTTAYDFYVHDVPRRK